MCLDLYKPIRIELVVWEYEHAVRWTQIVDEQLKFELVK